MVERSEQARLSKQIAEVDVLPVGHLDRDLLVDPGVFGEVNGAESAAAERRQDFVLSDGLTTEKHWTQYTGWADLTGTRADLKVGTTYAAIATAYGWHVRTAVMRADLKVGTTTWL